MKNLINKFLAAGALLFLFVACEDDPTLTVLEKVDYTGAPEVSSSSIVLSVENEDESVLTVSWEEAVFPVDAPVTYTLEMATLADTSGATSWPIAREIGKDVFTTSFTGLQLNEFAAELEMEPETEGTIVIRVRAYLDRNAYSPAVAVKVTPYEYEEEVIIIDYPALWVAGDFQGWDITTATKIVSVNDDRIYEGYFYIPEGGTNEFKLYAQLDWGPTSYGDGGEGTVIEHNEAGNNFVAPASGYYLFLVDLNEMTYELIETSWGLIGAATPGGWDADTEMVFDPVSQTWSVTADMLANGSFKFRANKAWVLDFGIDANGHLGYANHPWNEYIEQPQLTVPEDGNYTITLDLRNAGTGGNYRYTIIKN